MELFSSLFRVRRIGYLGRLRGLGSRKFGQCCGYGSDIMLGVFRRGLQLFVRLGEGEGSRWTTCYSGCVQFDQIIIIINIDLLQGIVFCLKRIQYYGMGSSLRFRVEWGWWGQLSVFMGWYFIVQRVFVGVFSLGFLFWGWGGRGEGLTVGQFSSAKVGRGVDFRRNCVFIIIVYLEFLKVG